MRFRRRDHESFIGGYDPEHEMPNPDRGPGDRWQSDAYRRNARDSRYMYRWNPDRIEGRDWQRDRGWDPRNEIHPRDRYENRYGGYGMIDRYARPWDRGDNREYDRGYERGYNAGLRDRDRLLDRGLRRDEWDRDEWFDNRDYFRR